MVNHLMSILLIMPFLIVILLKLIQKLTLTMYYKRFILDYKLNKKSIIEEYFISPIFLMQLVVLMVSCNNFGECYSQVFLRLAQLMVLSVKCIELKVKINHYILIQMEIRNKMEMFAWWDWANVTIFWIICILNQWWVISFVVVPRR